MALSHRDRRAHRRVMRGWVWLAAAAAGFTVLAVVLPGWLGLFGVVALAASGGAYLVSSGRLLSEYGADLRAASDEALGRDFLRVEVVGVGGDRTVGLPSGRSPHARRRSRPPSRTDPSTPEALSPEGSLSRLG